MRLYIKYMVSLRCKILVQEELERINQPYTIIDLGYIEINGKISERKRDLLRKHLLISGLELLDDKRNILIERIKNVIIDMIHVLKDAPEMNYSDYISQKIGYDYTYLSNMFSEVKGITIQQFIIIHKIEKAKELLLYGEYNLTEISYQLNYSSVAHLSAQFKKITGLTPTFYKNMKYKRRSMLENV